MGGPYEIRASMLPGQEIIVDLHQQEDRVSDKD